MIQIKIGNIFESDKEVLVNTVNCVGVMGKGIAKTYKEKFPKMFEEYKYLCMEKEIVPGKAYPYYENGKVRILNFPTKQHWRSPSKLEYITNGLDWFVQNYQELGIKSIAFPPLGCGNGGLDWKTVGPVMYQKLSKLPIDIDIYAPFGTSKEYLTSKYLLNEDIQIQDTGIVNEPINKNWLLVLQLVKHLSHSKYSIKVGRTIFQKMCYVLSRYGTDLGLKFVKGTYGPYSSEIKKMITILSNHNLIIEKEYGQMILLTVNNNFKINPDDYSAEDKDNVNKTFRLFQRIKDTEQAELITTILFSYDQLNLQNNTITENSLFNYIINWKKRYNTDEYEKRIRELSKNLTSMGLINVDYSHDFKEYDFI